MKKMIFSLVIAVLGLTTTSCILEEGDTPPRETKAGKLIFDYSEQFISANLALADIAIKVNKFSETPADQKNAIEDRFFPQFKPRATGNTWALLNSDYVITTDGKSLETTGAKWRVSQYEGKFIVNIECTGDKQWKLTSQNSQDWQYTGNTDLLVKALLPAKTVGPYLYDYSVDGTCNFMSIHSGNYENSNRINCTVKEPMKFIYRGQQSYFQSYSNFYAAGGKIEMIVNNMSDPEKRDLIIADLSSSVGTNIVNRITFKGITQVW
ncbi:MAG: hypothetical protein A2X18_04240 [Bacteroidetes bacterium GWF2_40_14]|nr:MAG: hypothetical protein A2X18_04240 [Bacteroidetes bacterium GWF2_40_14]